MKFYYNNKVNKIKKKLKMRMKYNNYKMRIKYQFRI